MAKQERIKLREQRKAEEAVKKAAEDAAAAAAVNEAIVGDVAFAAAQAATMGPSAKEMVLVEGRLVCWSHRKKKGKVWKCFELSKEELAVRDKRNEEELNSLKGMMAAYDPDVARDNARKPSRK